MAEHVFYSKQRKGNEREITLQTAALLVGKAPTKQKRIRIKLQMPLSGKKTAGAPEWITNAYEFVLKNHDTVTPEIMFRGFDIEFSAEQLFGERTVKTTKAQMKSFEVTEVGDSENPDVVMGFAIYAPFSGRLWQWCGQMGGESFWAKFDQAEPEEEDEDDDQLELTGGDEEQSDEEGDNDEE